MGDLTCKISIAIAAIQWPMGHSLPTSFQLLFYCPRTLNPSGKTIKETCRKREPEEVAKNKQPTIESDNPFTI